MKTAPELSARLANRPPECRAAVQAAVGAAPPLTDDQRERLRHLLRPAPAAEVRAG